MRHPNLLLAGFVKCGTTSVAKHLASHPAVLTPVAKELYYLTDDASPLRSMLRSVDKAVGGRSTRNPPEPYFDYFPPPDDEAYALDATPHYYSQQRAMEYARDATDVKVIFMVRHPVARLVSSYHFFRDLLQEYPDTSFREFVEAVLDIDGKRAAYRSSITKAFFRYVFDAELDMGNFERHITRWESAIGADRVFVGTMEELREQPALMMERLCGFLEIDNGHYQGYEFLPYMQSYKVKLPLLHRLWRKIGKEDLMRYDRIARFYSPFHFLPGRKLRELSNHAYLRFQQHQPRPIDPNAISRLDEYYADHNKRLRDRYSIDYVGRRWDAEGSTMGQPRAQSSKHQETVGA